MAQQAIKRACHHLLRPVVRMLLRSGITWKDFAELSKGVYVEVAREDYGLRGRPTNASRVALMTGLSRREVARVRDLLDTEQSAAPRTAHSRLSQVLSGWHQDPEFLDAAGRPLELTPTGIKALLDRYGGDLPSKAILKEMKHVGLIQDTSDGRLRVLSRTYLRSPVDPDIMRQAGVTLHDHGETIAHNVDAQRSGPPLFDRMVSNPAIPDSARPAFRAFVEQQGQQFLEMLDAWLSQHEIPQPPAAGETTHRVGVGMFLFEEPAE
jgi:hypothetical protein